jgi:hypothetical protein
LGGKVKEELPGGKYKILFRVELAKDFVNLRFEF